ncbi:MAG: hypothetical protein ACYSTN_06260 [Planctomycetota bacterium]
MQVGLFRSACGVDAPTSFCVAHSCSAAGPSDTGLDSFAIEGWRRFHGQKKAWLKRIWWGEYILK